MVVWASLRLSALGAVSVTSLAGAFAVVCTVVGLGSFAQVDDARVAAILVQAFFLSMVVVALTLSLSVQDRDRSLTLLREATLEAQERSRERDLVLANLEEGVVLLGEDGTTLMRNEAAGRLLGDALPASPAAGRHGDRAGRPRGAGRRRPVVPDGRRPWLGPPPAGAGAASRARGRPHGRDAIGGGRRLLRRRPRW